MDAIPIGEILEADPYLAYQPAFAFTLPIQLFVNGITLTLLCVLMIHLICEENISSSISRLTSLSHDPVSLPLGPAQLYLTVPIYRHSYHFRYYQMRHHPAVLRRHWGQMALRSCLCSSLDTA